MLMAGDRVKVKEGAYRHSPRVNGLSGVVIRYGGYYSTPEKGRHRLVYTHIDGYDRFVVLGEDTITSLEITRR